jgi:hypothetical protein
MGSLYEQDLVAWAEQQASLLRAGRFAAIDAANLAEQIESLGASERRELRNRLARVLQHLLKWQYQPGFRSSSWATAIRVQRDELAAVLDDSPSLRRTLPDILPRAYALGRGWAMQETGLLDLPEACPWTVEQVVATGFLPE